MSLPGSRNGVIPDIVLKPAHTMRTRLIVTCHQTGSSVTKETLARDPPSAATRRINDSEKVYPPRMRTISQSHAKPRNLTRCHSNDAANTTRNRPPSKQQPLVPIRTTSGEPSNVCCIHTPKYLFARHFHQPQCDSDHRLHSTKKNASYKSYLNIPSCGEVNEKREKRNSTFLFLGFGLSGYVYRRRLTCPGLGPATVTYVPPA
ncbi:hypothetical protein F5I97DRAFT_1892797, partial [Phlebopus sp. FC_14]